MADSVLGSGGGFSQQVLELGEDLLDRVEVGRVFRQEEELGASRSDRASNGSAFVASEIDGVDAPYGIAVPK
jgi:hypothetical protein